MALIPWKPFRDLEQFFGDDDWFLPIFSRHEIMPAMDVYETDKEVVAEVDLPNIDPSKVEVSIQDGILRVSGTREESKEEKERGYWKKEIRKGSFERAVRLPAEVKEEEADATYEKGLLKIVIPKVKQEARESKKINIKVK